MPTLNCEGWIHDSLERIKKLSYDKKDIELVFVDGESTDKTLRILEEFRDKNVEKYKGIKIHKHFCNIPEARNMCIQESIGEYVFFVDSDIILNENCVERLLNHLGIADIATIYYDGCSPSPPKKRLEYVENVGMGCTMLTRETVNTVGWFNPFFTRWEDAEFCLRARRKNLRILLDSTTQVHHRKTKELKDYRLRYFLIAILKKKRKVFFFFNHIGSPVTHLDRFLDDLSKILILLFSPSLLLQLFRLSASLLIRRKEFFLALTITHVKHFNCYHCARIGGSSSLYQIHIYSTFVPKFNSRINSPVHVLQLPNEIIGTVFPTEHQLRFYLFLHTVKQISLSFTYQLAGKPLHHAHRFRQQQRPQHCRGKIFKTSE
jgi:glycosyltransferase involved in cell wall biosynthesis